MLTSTIQTSELPNLGLTPTEVKLTPYTPQWSLFYAEEVRRICENIAGNGLFFEHIGSTAVPGIYSKPIIDIMIGTTDEPSTSIMAETLIQQGYINHGEKGIPGRIFLTYGDPRIFHIHLVSYGQTFWKEHIEFRNELIQNPATARQYEQIKLALMEKFPNDRNSYTDGKSSFILSVLNPESDNSVG